MMNKRSLSGIVAASIVTLGLTTSAFADVSCPSVSEVKKAVTALNTVMRQSERTYFVLSAQPAFNSSDLDWMIAAQASGNGFDAAYSNGQSAVKGVVAAATDTPIEQNGFLMCAYMSSTGGMNVMTIAQQKQKFSLTPSVLNFDLFNVKK